VALKIWSVKKAMNTDSLDEVKENRQPAVSFFVEKNNIQNDLSDTATWLL
jgi:hypothetical protein